MHRFADEGSLYGSALAVSPDNKYLAAGSSSGIVNLYDVRKLEASLDPAPKPEKAFPNLTTSVSGLSFGPSSEILAMHSEAKDNAVKLAHVPSRTVFENFPGAGFNLKRVNCVDFSLNGGYLSVGNNAGAANLYQLKHFGSF